MYFPFSRHILPAVLAFCFVAIPAGAQDAKVSAFLYSTMPSTSAHRPEMAMDGDDKTYFQSVYGMDDGDDFRILLSRPIAVSALKITTGNAQNEDLLTRGKVEITTDGNAYQAAATFDKNGVAQTTFPAATTIAGLKIRLDKGRGIPALLLREITFDSPDKPTNALIGPGRGFTDITQAPDVADWARRAEDQMEEFWPDTQALLYSDGFITPNAVNVIYRSGPDVTPVAATGGGVMTVNADWVRKWPNDTGLTVHEMAHVVQSMSAYNPVWLIEGVADYIRWAKFEPQNHKPSINVKTATYHDSYRTTGTFLAWCEMHYDSALVTKLNNAVRFGKYDDGLFEKFCGKNVDALWAEFLADYKADPVNILTTPLAAADRPRTLPTVDAAAVPIDLKAAFNSAGFVKDEALFSDSAGFDAGGAAFSATLLGTTQTANNVRFDLGPAEGNNLISSAGQIIALPNEKFASLWLLGAAVEGNQMAQTLTVTYTDGTTQKLAQNFSDWYQPRNFSGESRAVKMDYRNMSNGSRDARTFYAYSYGFSLDADKTVQSVTLPDNANVKILAMSVAK